MAPRVARRTPGPRAHGRHRRARHRRRGRRRAGPRPGRARGLLVGADRRGGRGIRAGPWAAPAPRRPGGRARGRVAHRRPGAPRRGRRARRPGAGLHRVAASPSRDRLRRAGLPPRACRGVGPGAAARRPRPRARGGPGRQLPRHERGPSRMGARALAQLGRRFRLDAVDACRARGRGMARPARAPGAPGRGGRRPRCVLHAAARAHGARGPGHGCARDGLARGGMRTVRRVAAAARAARRRARGRRPELRHEDNGRPAPARSPPGSRPGAPGRASGRSPSRWPPP